VSAGIMQVGAESVTPNLDCDEVVWRPSARQRTDLTLAAALARGRHRVWVGGMLELRLVVAPFAVPTDSSR
jgi:hypothetical protein